MLPLPGSSDLDTFLRDCDAVGGIDSPGAAGVMEGFRFDVDRSPLEGLDPRGADYLDFQIDLYHLLAGREIDQPRTELTQFDIDYHVGGTNPYNNISPSMAATHLLRLLTLLRAVDPPKGGRLLDLGAGWGLSSEIFAYAGCAVTAVDINPQFVELIRRRTERSGLPVHSVAASFEAFEAEPASFDMATFYECLHHAVRPWVVIDRVATMIKAGGSIGLVNEPVNDLWPHWGLRLDALSVYCIRKFGWFESGWSLPFITDCLERAGLAVEVMHDSSLGTTIIARKG